MGRLTTHVLDTALGKPGAGVRVRLYRRQGADYALIKETSTNADGRCDAPLLEAAALTTGRYRLIFDAASYFAAQGIAQSAPPFLDEIVVDFGISDPQEHFHVPLLLSPYGYSTYRGS